MLLYRADWQTLLYMASATALLGFQWQRDTFSPILFALQLALAFATSIMHHNHRHLPMWRAPLLNRLSDGWFTAFQGQPGIVFDLCHNENHHRYCNGPADYTRTYRYHDDNTLVGLIRHPFESALTLTPIIVRYVVQLRHTDPAAFRSVLLDYAWLAIFTLGAVALDPHKALLYVLIPQAFALFWLLAANYLQHAHTDEQNRFRAARNFLGLVNPLCFNIGLHTAHHLDGRQHWSELPATHRKIAHAIDKRLIEPSLTGYFLRVLTLGPFVSRWRSVSLRRAPGQAT